MPDSSGDKLVPTSGKQIGSTAESFGNSAKALFTSRLFFIFSAVILVLFVAILFFVFVRRERLTPETLNRDISKLNQGNFRDASSGESLSQEELNKTFLEPLKAAEEYKNDNKHLEDFYKYGKYVGIYTQTVGQYYATRDPEILQTAKNLRQFIKENFPKMYTADEQSDPSLWEIVE